jgi:hypothetical protein
MGRGVVLDCMLNELWRQDVLDRWGCFGNLSGVFLGGLFPMNEDC